jgi:hypothetical protein
VHGGIYYYTSTGYGTLIDNITGNEGVGNNIVLAGTDATANDTVFAIANNLSDNQTATAYRIAVGTTTGTSSLWGTDNLTLAWDNATTFQSQTSLCADARYMSATGANTRGSSTDNATLFVGYMEDNSSWTIKSKSDGGLGWSAGVSTAASSDNATQHYCAMTVTKHGNDNGTLYMAAKSNIGVYTVYKLTGINSLAQGNLTALGTITVGATALPAGAGSVDIGFDTDDNSTVVTVNDGGNIELWRNYSSYNSIGESTFTAITAGDMTGQAFDRVSLAVQPSKYAIGSMGSTDNASIKIFYDE